ncbi:methyltransferase domain-containing protein [Oceanicella sp. SM1341]|uniref:methyltransferase domain-containing protein n=1 Tax=Oceanicella sp. SM1341 TaxID=1548889 RepID=UPI000E4D213D|nr:methyltransferase domain-containing protein [Oceanicella sp. SM1341]
MGFNQSVNGFRARRGRLLRRQIEELSRQLGREITVLDLGGRAAYWENVGLDNIARIDLLNTSEAEFGPDTAATPEPGLFRRVVGDACDLAHYADKSVDLVHSNSVIEHVGGWARMRAMAREALRVGRSGWVQTPAWEFPVEPHFHLPFMHWFETPLRSRMIGWSPLAVYRDCDLDTRRTLAEGINLVSRREFRALFPGTTLHVERFVLSKSYTARRMP